MADLVVPQLGESITEAVIARWRKNVGDAVEANDILVDLETDKVTVELPSPVAGALTEQRAQVGQTVKVGEIVGKVADGEKGKAAPAQTQKQPSPSPSPSPSTSTSTSTSTPSASTARAAAASGGLDREALLELPPSQRRIAREQGRLPRATIRRRGTLRRTRRGCSSRCARWLACAT